MTGKKRRKVKGQVRKVRRGAKDAPPPAIADAVQSLRVERHRREVVDAKARQVNPRYTKPKMRAARRQQAR